MTDNEIKKALECCYTVNMPCEDCPLYDNTMCNESLGELALDLINRQKAEIETLERKLYDEGEALLALNHQLLTAKSEAIKEFAERLKMANATKLTWFNEDFDNLVKEMVGDTE